MKKMNIEVADKLFEGVSKKFDTPEVVEYKVGEEVYEVELYTNLNLIDRQTLVDAVYINAIAYDEDFEIHRDCFLAYLIIENLTNIPTPTLENEDGEIITDLIACYEIVFGYDGIRYLSDRLDSVIWYVIEAVYKKMEVNKTSSVEQLATKLLELIDYAKLEINDIIDNPVRQEQFLSVIEGMKKSDE